jgi:hypothetical protein
MLPIGYFFEAEDIFGDRSDVSIAEGAQCRPGDAAGWIGKPRLRSTRRPDEGALKRAIAKGAEMDIDNLPTNATGLASFVDELRADLENNEKE